MITPTSSVRAALLTKLNRLPDDCFKMKLNILAKSYLFLEQKAAQQRTRYLITFQL